MYSDQQLLQQPAFPGVLPLELLLGWLDVGDCVVGGPLSSFMGLVDRCAGIFLNAVRF